MPSAQLGSVVRYLGGLWVNHAVAGVVDAELLRRYVLQKDQTAFEALLRRHGPMVLSVCRRLLGNEHDTEDAFQATFLVLIRKASGIREPGKLGNWLYGVAYHTAMQARAAKAMRRAKEAKVKANEQNRKSSWLELLPCLDQELQRLPDKYRSAVVLCDLEGRTRKEAAREMGCAEGTVASRLARARSLLARRLARYGEAVSGGALAAMLSENSTAVGMPQAWISPLLSGACNRGRDAAASAASLAPRVVRLAEGVIRTMVLKNLIKATALLLITAVLVTGAGLMVAPSLARETGNTGPAFTRGKLLAQAARGGQKKQGPRNLLINGSFEEGVDISERNYLPLNKGSKDIKGWEVTRGQIDYEGLAWQHADGRRSIDLHGSPGFGGIKQTFKTKPGQKYRLTFFMAGNPVGEVPVKKMGVEVAGKKEQFRFDTQGKTLKDMGWTSHVLEFTAIDSRTTVEFYTLMKDDASCGPALDNVSIVTVDE
jgi:RNA polymerase sigma factor (sigma-70 family)